MVLSWVCKGLVICVPDAECAAFAIFVPLSIYPAILIPYMVRIQESVRRLQYRTDSDDKGGCRQCLLVDSCTLRYTHGFESTSGQEC